MLYHSGALAVALLVIVPVVPLAIASDDAPAAPAAEEKSIKLILAAKKPSEAAAGFRELFKSVDADGLRRLQSHRSDTIAVQAAWEQVEMTVPENPEHPTRPDRDTLAWFIGFLEGRTRVRAPLWWKDAILDARANRRGNIYAGGLNALMDAFRRGLPDMTRKPRKAILEDRDGKLAIRVGDDSAVLPDDFEKKIDRQSAFDKAVYNKASVFITPSRCYVAMHDNYGLSYRIACVDRQPLKVRWISDVWAAVLTGPFTGIHFQWVEVIEQDDKVVVFAVTPGRFYVEAFRTDDGANVFRFSNGYSPG